MPSSGASQNSIAAFLLGIVIIGAATGTAIGLLLGGLVDLRWTAFLASFIAVSVIELVRRRFSKSSGLDVAPRGVWVPVGIWISAFYSIVVGGLAGHDFGQLLGAPAAPMIGLFCGTIASMSMATFMLSYYLQRP